MGCLHTTTSKWQIDVALQGRNGISYTRNFSDIGDRRIPLIRVLWGLIGVNAKLWMVQCYAIYCAYVRGTMHSM